MFDRQNIIKESGDSQQLKSHPFIRGSGNAAQKNSVCASFKSSTFSILNPACSTRDAISSGVMLFFP